MTTTREQDISGLAPMGPEEHPALGPLVTVDPPLDDDGVWVVAHDGVPRARVSSSVADVARRFTGERSVEQIARDLGDPWTSVEVGQVARRLASAGYLRDVQDAARPRPPKARKRLSYRPPLTFQWSFGDPTPMFRALRPVTRFATGAPGLVVGVVVVMAGILAAIISWDDIVRVLEQPVTLPVLAVVAVAIVLTTVLHEVGHGAALSNFGGSPRRIGAMLFYLAPAFFCDVTDGWRLSRRSQRVIVALAGPAVHLIVACLCVVGSLFIVDPGVHAGLVLYATVCVGITALNLLPFVQLDGYLALMSALDMPHLRRTAMDEATRAFAGFFFGVASARPASRRTRRLAVFGTVCWVFPVALVGFVLYRYATSIAGMGALPAAVYFAMLALVLVVFGRTLWRGIRSLAGAGPSALRTTLTVALGAAAVASVLVFVPVTTERSAGFTTENDTVYVVATDRSSLPPAEAEISLSSNGILLSEPLGTAIVGPGPAQSADVALSALVPVSGTTLTTPAARVALVDVASESELPQYGRARYEDAHGITIAEWVWRTFVVDPFGSLAGWSGA